MVVKALLPELLELREAGVSSASFDAKGNLVGVEFFASAPVPAAEEPEGEKATDEPEIPAGFINAANAFKPKKQGAA